MRETRIYIYLHIYIYTNKLRSQAIFSTMNQPTRFAGQTHQKNSFSVPQLKHQIFTPSLPPYALFIQHSHSTSTPKGTGEKKTKKKEKSLDVKPPRIQPLHIRTRIPPPPRLAVLPGGILPGGIPHHHLLSPLVSPPDAVSTTLNPPVKHHLGHDATRPGRVLHAPARVAARDPQAGRARGPDERDRLVAEAHVPGQVARLARLDGRGGEGGRDGGQVGRQVVALEGVAPDEVGCGRERVGRVWFAWEEKREEEKQG